MSDESQGPDWWLATDGKWYPPKVAVGEAPAAKTESEKAGGGKLRKPWVWAAAVVVIVAAILIPVLTTSSANSTHSLSYRDGAVIGKKLEQHFAQSNTALCTFDSCVHQGPIIYASESTIAKCLGIKFQLPNGLPAGDNASQWVTGCVAGYEAATHPAN